MEVCTSITLHALVKNSLTTIVRSSLEKKRNEGVSGSGDEEVPGVAAIPGVSSSSSAPPPNG